MRKFILLVLSLITSLTIMADSSLYQVTVPVASQSQNDWQAGISNALAQVIVKVGGNDSVLKSKKIKSALTQASNYVQGYTYITNSSASNSNLNSLAMNAGNNSQNSLLLQVQFYPQAINQLLQNAGTQSWAKQQRPVTLIWLATQTPQGLAIINNNSNDTIATLLQNDANNRGLPILLPMMDLQDMQNVGVHDVWQLDSPGVIIAAKRYGANNILEAKISSDTKQQQWNAQWVLIINGQSMSGNAQGNNANQVIAAMLNKVADNVANKTANNNSVQTQQVVLSVTNVSGLDDYADIVKYLRSLPPVTDVEVGNIDPENLSVNVTVSGGAQALANAINAGTQMQSVPNPDPNSKILTYRWNAPANNAAPNNAMVSAAASNNNNNNGIDMGS